MKQYVAREKQGRRTGITCTLWRLVFTDCTVAHDLCSMLFSSDRYTEDKQLTHTLRSFFTHSASSPPSLFHPFFLPPPHRSPSFQLRRRAFDVTGCYYLTQLCRAPWAPRNRQMLCFPFEESMRKWVRHAVKETEEEERDKV